GKDEQGRPVKTGGFIYGLKLECKNCNESILQTVKIETTTYYKNNSESNSTEGWVEGFPIKKGEVVGWDLHYLVQDLPRNARKICFNVTLTACCGLYLGKPVTKPGRIRYGDPDNINCGRN